MLNEIRLKQSANKEEAPITRSKWNVQPKKEEEKEEMPSEIRGGSNLLEDTINSNPEKQKINPFL